MIVLALNPYKVGSAPDFGIKKFGAGNGGGHDPDFWLDVVQSSYHPGLGSDPADPDTPPMWQHMSGGLTTLYPIRKALRIAYIVPDKQRHLTLDHLLIGYVEPDTTVSEPPFGTRWGAADPSTDANSDLGALGRLIMVRHYPTIAATWGTSWPSSRWVENPPEEPQPNADPLFNEDPGAAGYAVRPRFWRFRGVDCRVEKSVLVTYSVVPSSGTARPRGRLLVGYEGGGGW